MISVIIVNYKVADLLVNAIESVYRSTIAESMEVIVIDNHSEDDSRHRVTQQFNLVTWIQNDENTGFAHAVNQGLRIAQGDAVVLLNPDSYLDPVCLNELLTCLKSDPKIGIVGGRVVNPDGSIQKQCRRNIPTLRSAFFRLTFLSHLLPSLRLSREYEIAQIDDRISSDVEAVSGSLMMISRRLQEQIGYLDEAFFLFGEDLDYCLRARNAGYRVMYCPSARAMHYRGESRKKRPFTTLWHTHHAMEVFYRKHFRDKHPLPVQALVRLGIWCRWILLTIFEGARAPFSGHMR